MGSLGDLFVEVWVAGMAGFTSAMNTVASVMNSAGNAAAAMLGKLGKASGVLDNLGKAVRGLAGAGAGTARLLGALGNLGASLVHLIPVAGAVGKALYNMLNVAIGGKLSATLGAISAKFAQLASALKPIFGTIAAAAQFAWNAIKSQAALLANDIKMKFTPLVTSLKNTFDTIKLGAQMAWGVMGKQFAALFSGKVGMYLKTLAGVAKTNFNTIAMYAKAAWPQIAATLGPVATQLGNIMVAFKDIAVGCFGVVAASAKAAGSMMQYAWSNVVPIVGPIFVWLKNAVSSFAGFVKSTFSALGSAILYPFKKLYSFIFSLKGAIAALGVGISAAGIFKYIAEVTTDAENAQVAFTAMLGSQEKSIQMLKDIKKLADTTPLELPEVRSGARSLVAYGFAASEVVERLRMLGDISQGSQVPLNDLVGIYGKMFEMGRITGMEFRQLAMRHIPIMEELVKITGKEPTEIRKMGEEGRLQFKFFEQALKNLTGEGGRFHDMLGKMGATVTGRFSTLKDSIRSLGLEFGGGLTIAMKKAIDVAIKFTDLATKRLSIYRDRIKEVAEVWAAKFEAFGDKLSGAFDKAMPYIVEFSKTIWSLKTAMTEITEEVVTMVVKWVGGNAGIQNGLMGLVRWTRFLADNWRLVGELGLAYIKNWATDGIDFAKEFGSQLMKNLRVFADGMANTFTSLFQVIAEGLKQAFREAQADLKWPFNMGAKAPDWSKFNTLIKNGLKADFKNMFLDLPGLNLSKMLNVGQSKEVTDALAKLANAKAEFDKNVFNEDARNAMERARREAEDAMNVELGGKTPQHELGGKASKNHILNPVAFYNKLAEGVTPHQRRTENWQGNVRKDLHDIAAAVRGMQGGGRPMPAVLG